MTIDDRHDEARKDGVVDEAPTGAELSMRRALVLIPVPPRGRRGGSPAHSLEDQKAEAVGLVEAIDLKVAEALLVPLPVTRPGTLFGSGKVAEIKALVRTLDTGLVIIDFPVSPIQQRNLEKAWGVKVLDRTGLILEIFGRRAATREGRLQVELAHLTYQKSRLVRSWTHLERQRGGAGFLGGPGERQLELDRRMLQTRIDAIREELAEVVRTRELHRAGRRKVPYPVVAIVGYTNAGKSTLFNRITGASVLAKDQVFATLDPIMREVRLESGRRVILSDTVGFISDLPTMLVAAFRATLEEVVGADLILHVRDIAHAESEAQRIDVERVLADLGIDPVEAEAPILEVWNKVDLIAAEKREEFVHAATRARHGASLVSAITGEGIEALLKAIDVRLGKDDRVMTVTLPATAGRLLSWLYENTAVIERATSEAGETTCKICIAAEKQPRLVAELKRAGIGFDAERSYRAR